MANLNNILMNNNSMEQGKRIMLKITLTHGKCLLTPSAMLRLFDGVDEQS